MCCVCLRIKKLASIQLTDWMLLATLLKYVLQKSLSAQDAICVKAGIEGWEAVLCNHIGELPSPSNTKWSKVGLVLIGDVVRDSTE